MSTLFQYLIWHYFDVPRGLLRVWRNFLKFNLNYFSIPLLFKSFFSPWRRYSVPYGRGFDIGRYFTTLFSNLIFRFLGMIMRSFLIIIGLLVEVFIIFGGLTIFFGWLILPILLIFGIYHGSRILF